MKNSLLTAVALSALSATATADYQFDVTGSYQNDASEVNNTDIDFGGLSLEANYYLRPVSTAAGILAESAFLDKASYVGVRYHQRELEVDGGIFSSHKVSADNFGFHGRFVAEGQNDIIVEADLAFGDSDDIGVAGGFYLNNQTEILFGILDSDIADTTIYVDGKTLIDSYGNNAIIAEGRIQINDGDLGVQAEGDLYLNGYTSVGARVGLYLEDDTRLAMIGKADYFVTDQLAVGGELGLYSVFDAGIGFKLFVTGRF
ncbi:MAG: hypothetical protein CSA52_02830 [Gammaproteobacteria bacterium]|nr:MAG: hypothetical protein CSB48_04500 [Pseudomonadota bacterium]PIE38334.1 MAG: hypothetical protein CSA52_02830 [Gammaproteobacteria bacterium]